MKVSIIIPVYNASDFIERSLFSALEQTYRDIECILVDDGSVDNSVELINDIINNSEKRDNIHFLLHETNRGVAAARNTGINHATGDYIFFLDSDDELPLNAIECLVEKAGNTNADLILGDFSMTGANKSAFKSVQLSAGSYEDRDILNSFLLMQWPDMTCNKLVRLETIKRHAVFFEEKIIHEDTLWSFVLAVKSSLMIVCLDITYIYHIQGESITQKKTDRNFESLLIILDKMISISAKNDLFNVKLPLRDYLIDYSFYMLKESIRCRRSSDESKNVFDEIRHQFQKIDSITKEISCGSVMKLMTLQVPFSLSFSILKLYLFFKR